LIVARGKPQYHSLPQLPGEKKQQRPKRVVRSLKLKGKITLLGLVGLFFCSSLIIAFYFAQVLVTGQMLNETKDDVTQLNKESQDLYARVTQFTSLDNIETLAVHRLGMVKPENDQTLLVQSAQPKPAPATGTAAAAEEKPKQQAEEKPGQNWVIRAFTNMLGHLEASIKTG